MTQTALKALQPSEPFCCLLGEEKVGKEAIAPIDVLKGYVAEAVRSENENIGRILIDQFRLLMDFLSRIMPKDVVLDSGTVVGALTPAIDVRLNEGWQHVQRGNVR